MSGIPVKYKDLSGLYTYYGESELRIAIAIAETLALNASSSGSGGTSDATSANQVIQISRLENIRDRLILTADNRLVVDNSQVTQPISNSALDSINNKVPARGANTAANSTPVTLANDGIFATSFGLLNDSAANSDGSVSSFLSLFKYFLTRFTTLINTLTNTRDRLPSDLISNRLAVDVAFPATQPVSASSLPLPSGAATSANQNTSNTSLTSIDNKLMPSGTATSYMGTSNGALLKSSAGNIYSIGCSNANTSIRYFQIFNQTSAPALNDVPVRSFPIPPDDSLFLLGQDIIGGNGIVLTTGIAWGFSSTRLTYTAATASDCIATVRWA